MMTSEQIQTKRTGLPVGVGRDTWSTWKAILWRDWRVNRKHLYRLIYCWIAFIFLFPIIFTEKILFMGLMGILLFLASRLGGSDLLEEREAYAFTLPLQRADYFLGRMLFGLAIYVAFSVVGTVSLYYGLSGKFWGLLLESGFTERAFLAEGFWERVFRCQFASIVIYLVIYVMASAFADSKTLASLSWLIGLGIFGLSAIVVPAILLYAIVGREDYSVENFQRMSLYATGLLGILALILGWKRYRIKEAAVKLSKKRTWVFWLIVVLIISMFMFLPLVLSVFFWSSSMEVQQVAPIR